MRGRPTTRSPIKDMNGSGRTTRVLLLSVACGVFILLILVPRFFAAPDPPPHIVSPASKIDSRFTANPAKARGALKSGQKHISVNDGNLQPNDGEDQDHPEGNGYVTKAVASATPVKGADNSLFVSIASFRDTECAPTIEDMFMKAHAPENLFIGAVEQHDKEQDPSCFPPKFRDVICSDDAKHHHPEQGRFKFCPSKQIRQLHVHHATAKGPTFGRYMAMKMYKGERYFMMIDSHNRFVTAWDKIAIDMLNNLPAKSVLSHYPEAWNNPVDGSKNAPLDNRPSVAYMCKAKFVQHLGYPRFDGVVFGRPKKPRPQPWAAAGFLFAHGSMVQQIPFDPNLDYIFDGEEVLYSVRMWTHGYDIYSPNQNILYHYYYRPKAKKFWSILPHNHHVKQGQATRRIQMLLGTYKFKTKEYMVDPNTQDEALTKDLDIYGLGKERTVDQWWEYAGIDRSKQTSHKDFCKLYERN